MLDYKNIFNLYFQNNNKGNTYNFVSNRNYTQTDVVMGYSYIFSNIDTETAAKSMGVDSTFILLLNCIYTDAIHTVTEKIHVNPDCGIHDVSVLYKIVDFLTTSNFSYEEIGALTNYSSDVMEWIDAEAEKISILWSRKK